MLPLLPAYMYELCPVLRQYTKFWMYIGIFTSGGRKHRGNDVKCSGGSKIHAPFDGKVTRKAIPYRANHKLFNKCCNTGFVYVSTDADWPGKMTSIMLHM